jgi:hypothetical protein
MVNIKFRQGRSRGATRKVIAREEPHFAGIEEVMVSQREVIYEEGCGSSFGTVYVLAWDWGRDAYFP